MRQEVVFFLSLERMLSFSKYNVILHYHLLICVLSASCLHRFVIT